MSVAAAVGLCAAAVVLSYAGVALLRIRLQRWRLLDIPNDRSSHTQPTPRGGGLVIALVTLAGLATAGPFFAGAPPEHAWVALAGAVLVAVVSGIDDFRSVSSILRFSAHTCGAGFALAGLGAWRAVTVPAAGVLELGLAGPVLTCIWIVGLTNAYNFMDGIDGIAAGQGIVAGAAWALLGALGGSTWVVAFGVLLAAASLGFLAHNTPPARIFMGDVGSAFLGFSFAVAPLLMARTSVGHVAASDLPLAAVFFVWPFVFDTTLTIVRRLRRRENIFAAHRSHLYQRLVIAGYPHGAVSALYVVLALAGAAAFLAWLRYRLPAAVLLVPAGLAIGLWSFVLLVEKRTGQPSRDPASGSAS